MFVVFLINECSKLIMYRNVPLARAGVLNLFNFVAHGGF